MRRDPEDELARQEADAAASEAASIGGEVPAANEDPALDPVEQAGGGESEGFEQAEDALREQASHGDPATSPTQDEFPPERESDLSTAAYGEPDEVDSTEVVADPDEPEDDPGRGPGLAADR